MKWVTRERPKIDRIACPWLIRKFIDQEAEFLYVPKDQVMKVAKEQGRYPLRRSECRADARRAILQLRCNHQEVQNH
jgi:hypothetical protein